MYLYEIFRYSDIKNKIHSLLVQKPTLRKVLNGILIPPFLKCFGAQTQVT